MVATKFSTKFLGASKYFENVDLHAKMLMFLHIDF